MEPRITTNSLGNVLGGLLPFIPSTARRAGAAELMSKRFLDPEERDKASWLVKYPVGTQAAQLAAAAAVGYTTESPYLAGAAYLIPQIMRMAEIHGIQTKYENQPRRRRLRDTLDPSDLLEASKLTLGGSHRLGTAQAYEAMRSRKWKNIPASSEMGDALGMTLPLLHLPITRSLDLGAVPKMLNKKKAAEGEYSPTDTKERISHRDQRKGPVVPYMLAAAIASAYPQYLAGEQFYKNLNGFGGGYIPFSRQKALVRRVSGVDPVLTNTPEVTGFHIGPTQTKGLFPQEMLRYTAHTGGPDMNIFTSPKETLKYIFSTREGRYQEMKARAKKYGIIQTQGPFRNMPVLAHEAGHAKIEQTPGFTRFLQRGLYRNPLLAGLSNGGAFGAGLGMRNPLTGALAGAGVGALLNAGTLLPEFMATRHGLKGLRGFKGGRYSTAKDSGHLRAAFNTYLASALALPALAGAAGGWIGSYRKKQQKAQEEEERKNTEERKKPEEPKRLARAA